MLPSVAKITNKGISFFHQNPVIFIKSSVTYASNDNYPSVLTDARGKSVTQDIDATLGVLNSVTDPRGQAVANTYDLLRRLTATTTTADGKTYKNTYTYTDGKLTQAAHNTDSDTDCDVAYHFAYDVLGNPTTARVGSQLLSERVYTETGDKLMKRLEYGNGGKVYYERDAYKRLTSVRFDEETEPRYVYDYDASGNVGRLTDNHLGETTSYESDFASRPGRAQTMAGNRHVYTQEVAYDGASRVAKARELLGENKTPYVTEYAYDSEDRPMEIAYGVPGKGVKYVYDSLGRLTARKLLDDASGYLTNYEYAQGGQGAGSTTALVQSIVQDGHSFTYTYDEMGNIVCENRNGLETTYEYDCLGQLTRVNDPHEGKTTTYEYDRGGNILVKKVYAYTKGALGTAQTEVVYAYGDTNWKDKLTAYDGTAITYDTIGNPLNDGIWAYTWKVGRQLEEMSKPGETVEFQYNANGLRVKKASTSRGVTEYILRGKQIAHLTRTLEGEPVAEMHFWYDAQGKAAMVSYNGKEYLYVYNVQGDVVALLDKGNGCAEVVEYHYDAWGRQASCTGSMADSLGRENPFRYRAYVYDEETGLYYLRSRYYNPVWGRFVNSDSVLTRNLYEYCRSNPVMKRDPLGTYDEDVPTNNFNLDASIKSQKQRKEYDAKYSSKNILIPDSPSQSFGHNNVPGSDVVMIVAQEMVPPADSGLSYFEYARRVIDKIAQNPTDQFHNFPLLVDVMTSPEDFQLLIGGDGKAYILIELPGEIAIANSNGETGAYSGSFEWIIMDCQQLVGQNL